MPEALLEAELFGHARGAFTGAVQAREGALEAANGGTIFLDEIGELPKPMQPRLLRFLETKTVRRLGEVAPRPVDVRMISATHRDLRTMVNDGSFREDLYFRLAVLPIRVPPLRERRDDIPLLIESFTATAGLPSIEPATLAEVVGRPWPGNVRELRHFVERVAVFGADQALALDGPPSRPTDDLLEIDGDLLFKVLRDRWLTHIEATYRRVFLAKHGRNVSQVARAAGLDRTYVHRLMRKHGLS